MPLFLSEQSLESARGECGEGGIGEDEVDKLNQELKDMRDSLAEKSKKLTERTEGAAKYDGFSFWIKINVKHILCCLKFLQVLIFAIFPAIRECKLQQIKNCRKYFSCKKFTPEQIT